MRRRGDWINTYRGQQFWPLDPRPHEIHIEDIAHALSMQCRFTGHVHRFYSVAEHCVRVSERCAPSDALWGLLHDASEAYLIDVARPVKRSRPMRGYRKAEARLMRAVCKRFALWPEEPASVKEADHRMLVTEAQALMDLHPQWLFPAEPYEQSIIGWMPARAEAEFLCRFKQLVNA